MTNLTTTPTADTGWGTAGKRQATRLFADKWATQEKEKQLAQSFWQDFFHHIVDVPDLQAAGIDFEHPVKTVSEDGRKTTKFIDVLWAGVALIEHKTVDKSLDEAEAQARAYLKALPKAEKAPFIICCDFARMRVVDVELGSSVEFLLADLPDHLDLLEAVFHNYNVRATRKEVAADKKAAALMVRLYKAFEEAGYEGHETSVFLVRLLLLLFGDDTRMWGRPGAFEDLLLDQPADGSTLGPVLAGLFAHLNDPQPPSNLPDYLRPFPYVNGGVFAEIIRTFHFTREMRDALVAAAAYQWADISPAIFGAMFQTVKSKEDRRELGEHYTSEADILKTIRPLFLDDLNARMMKGWGSAAALNRLRAEMGRMVFLDPACGAGNFLLVAYSHLRALELKMLVRIQELTGTQGEVSLDGLGSAAVVVSLEQFYGFEVEEWSSQIARVAMFLADRQADLAMEELVGSSPNRFPITQAAHIHTGSALIFDWAEKLDLNADSILIIFGNPPYYGGRLLNAEQRAQHRAVWAGVKAVGNLDFVTCWFLLAAKAMAGRNGRAAFVSTNSITNGTQPAILWGELAKHDMGIDFAHRSFRWNNSGGEAAAVSVVIIGFSANVKPAARGLWSYDSKGKEGLEAKVSRINAYLLDAPEVLITARTKPLSPDVEELGVGSLPVDWGHLSNISPEEAAVIRATDPVAAKYLRRVAGGKEFVENIERWGLWLVGANPADIRTSPVLRDRVAAVKVGRLASNTKETRKNADRATEWQFISHKESEFIVVPRTTTASRTYIPMGILNGQDIIATFATNIIHGGSKTTLGVLSSRAFIVWTHAVSGKLGDNPSISGAITYNNFPFPEGNKEGIAAAAERVLEVRKNYPTSTLADLYDDLSMPADLRKAHKALDAAVVAGYGLPASVTEEGLLEHLFTRYAELVEAEKATA